ncbi:SulP family inorganic anion transporter [Halarsenatibacter silvermanii]|nr:SulP family inorganic anion transporter [Halarsenatibacter silvermanii]
MESADDLPFLPDNVGEVKDDLLAGFSVAALALSQNMACALIAGLDSIYGLYTSIVAIASSLSGVEIDYFQAVLPFTFMVGAFQLMLVVLRLGELVYYVSRSVINGLTAGLPDFTPVGFSPGYMSDYFPVTLTIVLFITLFRPVGIYRYWSWPGWSSW